MADGERVIADAAAALRSGSLVLLVETEPSGEWRGAFGAAGEHVTAPVLNTMLSEGRGLLRAPAAPSVINRLGLPPMVAHPHTDGVGSSIVSVDLASFTSGESAASRSATIRALADSGARPEDFSKPGHVLPVQTAPGGVLERCSLAEAAVDLLTTAGVSPVAGLCAVLDGNGEMAGRAYLVELARRLDLPIVPLPTLLAYRARREPLIPETSIPTDYGTFAATCLTTAGLSQDLALVFGDPGAEKAPLVGVYNECAIGHAFSSFGCSCCVALHDGMKEITAAGAGVVVYVRSENPLLHLGWPLRPQEYRGNGVAGGIVDEKTFSRVSAILLRLGLEDVTLLTDGSRESELLERNGVNVVSRRQPFVVEELEAQTPFGPTPSALTIEG